MLIKDFSVISSSGLKNAILYDKSTIKMMLVLWRLYIALNCFTELVEFNVRWNANGLTMVDGIAIVAKVFDSSMLCWDIIQKLLQLYDTWYAIGLVMAEGVAIVLFKVWPV